MTYEVTMLDYAAPVVISSVILNRQDAGLPDGQPEGQLVIPGWQPRCTAGYSMRRQPNWPASGCCSGTRPPAAR